MWCVGKQSSQIAVSGSSTGELDGMEVHKIEDVADIYVVEVDMQSVFCILCGCAVDGKGLLGVL